MSLKNKKLFKCDVIELERDPDLVLYNALGPIVTPSKILVQGYYLYTTFI